MPQAVPLIGAGLSLYSAIKGGQQQGQANKINAQQLLQMQQQQAQQNALRQQALGRLQTGPQGAPGNPFSSLYGKVG